MSETPGPVKLKISLGRPGPAATPAPPPVASSPAYAPTPTYGTPTYGTPPAASPAYAPPDSVHSQQSLPAYAPPASPHSLPSPNPAYAPPPKLKTKFGLGGTDSQVKVTPTRGKPKGVRPSTGPKVKGSVISGRAIIGPPVVPTPTTPGHAGTGTPTPGAKKKKLKAPGQGPARPRKPKADGTGTPTTAPSKRPKTAAAAKPSSPAGPSLDGAEPAPPQEQPEEDEEPEEEDADADEYIGADDREIEDMLKRDALQKKLLFSKLSDADMRRIEAYRRLRLPEKLLSSSLAFPSKVGKNITMVILGAAKVHGADIVARAKEAQVEWGERGGLRPDHLMEGLRRYRVDKGDMLPKHTKGGDPGLLL